MNTETKKINETSKVYAFSPSITPNKAEEE